jgi:hypothetical protein
MESSLSKGEDGVHGHQKASKRLASFRAIGSQTARRDAAPQPDVTRATKYDKLSERCCLRSWCCGSAQTLASDMRPSPLWPVRGVHLRETVEACGSAMAPGEARTDGGAMPRLYPVAQAWNDATAEGEGNAPRAQHHGSRGAPRAV